MNEALQLGVTQANALWPTSPAARIMQGLLAGGIRASAELGVSVELTYGLAQFGLSDEARTRTRFVIS